jgi:hypothetical protein
MATHMVAQARRGGSAWRGASGLGHLPTLDEGILVCAL